MKTDKGVLSDEQAAWMHELVQAKANEYHIWRPSDWPEIERTITLARRR